MTDYDVASKMGLPDPETIEEATRQRNHWINAAAQHLRNEEYYRGLLDQIGAALGPDAYTADDGGVHDSVLRAKVPGLARVRITAADRLFALLDDIDTVSDMVKGDDKAYRQMVERIQRKRFDVATTDGYTVAFKAAETVS